MDVTRDENIITGNGPAVSRIFAKALADELSAHFQE
jgi:hypothetical protein